MMTKILLDIEINKLKVIFTYRFHKKRRKFISIFSKYDLSSVTYNEPYRLEFNKCSKSEEFLIEPKNLEYINDKLRYIFTNKTNNITSEESTELLENIKTTEVNLMQ